MDPQQLWDRSASAWISLLEKGHKNRSVLLDPALLRIVGNVEGLSACDVGCGEGRFSRTLNSLGAKMLGIEPTLELLNRAQSLDSRGRYVRGVGEAIPGPSDCFDLVVCYLVLIDIPDYRAAIREMARITKPGGRILIANINSFASTIPNPWIRDESGNLSHVVVKDYFGERANVVAWAGIEIINFHRPFEDYMKAFLAEGLRLLTFEEPSPTEADVAEFPDMADSRRTPNFHIMLWRKD